MEPTNRALIAAGLLLAVAAAAPVAAADPIVVDPDALMPTVMHCDPVLGCSTIHPELPDVGASCTASGDGSGVRVECHGT